MNETETTPKTLTEGSPENASPAVRDEAPNEPSRDPTQTAEEWFAQLFRPGHRILFDLYQTEINSINRERSIADKLYGLIQCIEIFHSDATAISELRFDMDWLNDVVRDEAQRLLDALPKKPSKRTKKYWLRCRLGLEKLEALIVINFKMEDDSYPDYGDFREFYDKDVDSALRALIRKQI